MNKIDFDQMFNKANEFIKKHGAEEENFPEKIRKYKKKNVEKFNSQAEEILFEIESYRNEKGTELNEDEKDNFDQHIDRYISQLEKIMKEFSAILNLEEEKVQKEKEQENLTKSQKQEIEKIKNTISELEHRLGSTNNEEEKKLYESIIKKAEEEIKDIKESMVKTSFLKKVSNLADNTFQFSKKIVKGTGEAMKTKEGRAMLGNQIYKTIGSVLAIKSIADWGGYTLAKVGEKTKLYNFKAGKRTDAYKWLEQKKESKEGRKNVNEGFVELLKIINEKEYLYNNDPEYNEKFSELTDKISEELEKVKKDFTVSIKQRQQDIDQINKRLMSLEEPIAIISTGRELLETEEISDLKKELQEKQEDLDKLLMEREVYVKEHIKPLSEARHKLKMDREKVIESSDNSDKFKGSKESLKEKIILYQQAIDSGRTPEFFDLPQEKRIEIETKIKDGTLNSQEKKKYFLSEEDQISLKRRLGKILLDNMNKQEEIDKKMNRDIDKVTEDYIRGKVSGVTIAKDALNTLVMSTLGPAFRGLVYGGASMAERFQNKKIEYNKEYEDKNIISRRKFLLKDTFFNSTLELYYGLSGKQLNVNYEKDAYDKLVTSKDLDKLEGMAKFGRILKSFGELTRGGMIGFQALNATLGDMPTNWSEIKGVDLEKIKDNLQEHMKEMGDSLKETMSGTPDKVLANMSENLFNHIKHTLKIDAKLEDEKSLNVEEKQEVNSEESLVTETKNDSIAVNEKSGLSGILGRMKKNLNESDLNNKESTPEVSSENLEVNAEIDSVETVDSLKTAVASDTTGVASKDLKVEEMISPIMSSENGVSDLEINESITANKDIDIAKVLALKERSGSIDDLLKEADSSGVVERGEGVSQTLGGKFEDSDMRATVINPDGTKIQGDIHLAHTGDTVIQKGGEIYILKTSGVKVSENDSLANAWIKVTENKLGRELTPEEIDQFDGEDGKLEWNEAKALHDKLTSEKAEVVAKNIPIAKDQANLEERINDFQGSDLDEAEHIIPSSRLNQEGLDTSVMPRADVSDNLNETENITVSRPNAEYLEESDNVGIDSGLGETENLSTDKYTIEDLRNASEEELRSFIKADREGGVWTNVDGKEDLDLSSDLDKIYYSQKLTNGEKIEIFEKMKNVMGDEDNYIILQKAIDDNLNILSERNPDIIGMDKLNAEELENIHDSGFDSDLEEAEHAIPSRSSQEELENTTTGSDVNNNLDEEANIIESKPNVEELEDIHDSGFDSIDKTKIYEQFFNNENASAMSKLNNETSTDVIIRLGRPIDMKSSDGSFVRVDRFRFTGEDSTGRHFEYFKVGKNDASEEVIFKLTENENGNGIDNIEIKGYDNIDRVDLEELEHIEEDSRPEVSNRLEDSFNSGVEDLNQIDTNLQFTNSDYSNIILKAEANNDLEALGKDLKLDVDGKKVEIDNLRLISKSGTKENGEITKHFRAHANDGKEYNLITREHWRLENSWDDSDKSFYVNDGVIEYGVKEILGL